MYLALNISVHLNCFKLASRMYMETAHSRGVCRPLELSFRLNKYSSKACASWGSVGGGGRSFRRQGVAEKGGMLLKGPLGPVPFPPTFAL